MTSYATTRNWKARIRRELARDLRLADRKRLADLRAAIVEARRARRAALAAIVADCKAARVEARERAKRLREELRDARREGARSLRQSCSTRRSSARAEHELELDKRRQQYAIAADEQRAERAVSDRSAPAKRRSASEARGESDEAVEANLPADLVPVWRVMKRTIRAGPRTSRTEAFLEWAQENPDEVWSLIARLAAEKLEKMQRDQAKLEREMSRATRYKRSPEQLARDLAEVPF
jgi:hypothetical protein